MSEPPIAVWPLAYHLAEEMAARNWRATDVAERMSGNYGKNVLMVNLLLAVQRDGMILDRPLLENLAGAFDVSVELLENLHASWIKWPESRQPFECPEHLLNGVIFPDNDLV